MNTSREWDNSQIGEPIVPSLPAVDQPPARPEQVAEPEPKTAATQPEDEDVVAVAAEPVSVVPMTAPVELAAPAIIQEQERPTKEGFFTRLKHSLLKTKQNLGSGFISLFRGKRIDDDLFDELEEQLLIADVGVETTRKIITTLTQHASRKQLK
ncbi:MAG: signal recognition particle receptor subunit alpha, partial [Serratia symbiotica]|nr:signal recognition particle receptor subunit alpha [Serratia symbiotica]